MDLTGSVGGRQGISNWSFSAHVASEDAFHYHILLTLTFGMLLSLHMRPLHSLLSYRLLLGTVLYALPTLHVCALGVAGDI